MDMHVRGAWWWGWGYFLFAFGILYEAGLEDFEEKDQLHLHITKNISQEKL